MAETFGFQTPYAYAANNPIKYKDKNGENPIIGALIGGVTEIGIQMVSNALTGQDVTDIDWADVGVATVAGAATGGFSSIANVGKGVRAMSAIAGGTAGQVFEAGVDIKTSNGEINVAIVGAPKETFNVGGVDVKLKGKSATDAALDVGFDKLGDVIKTGAKAIKNIEPEKAAKKARRELGRAAKGSNGEADRARK